MSYCSPFKTRISYGFVGLGITEGADVPSMVNKIIECSYDPESETWSYMRMRPDKDTPNAYHVYLKVCVLKLGERLCSFLLFSKTSGSTLN